MESKVYNQNGKETGKVVLPEGVFGAKWNNDLVHQVVVSIQGNARTPVAHTKDRSEVAGGGRKPWKQKGTGRARHGSRRSPIWIGGGVTHGPRNEKNYSKKINKKMKIGALYSVLSKKFADNEILFIDTLNLDEKKSAFAKKILQDLSKISGFDGLSTKRKNTALIATYGKNDNIYKSFSNFGNIAIEEARNLNPVDILNYKYLIISEPKESINFLSSKVEQKTSSEKSKKAESPAGKHGLNPKP